MIARLLVLLILIAAAMAPAQAHERSRSHSIWTVEDNNADASSRIEARFIVDARLTTLLLSVRPDTRSLEAALQSAITDGITVARAGQACSLSDPPLARAIAQGRVAARMGWTCPVASGPLVIDINVFTPLSANHVHFARLESNSVITQEALLSRNDTRVEFLSGTGPRQGWLHVLASYGVLGVEHILGGLDHLAFVAALLLLVTRLPQVLAITLGFTLGHSATLGLTALGYISPPTAAVEAIIGFSILFVAGEAVFRSHPQARRIALGTAAALLLALPFSLMTAGQIPALAWLGLAIFVAGYGLWLTRAGEPVLIAPALSAFFGLIHGVGFGGILVESGLPEARAVPALLGFNLGVEVGQLMAVAVMAGAVLALRRLTPASGEMWARTAMTLVVAGLGTYWFISRAWS